MKINIVNSKNNKLFQAPIYEERKLTDYNSVSTVQIHEHELHWHPEHPVDPLRHLQRTKHSMDLVTKHIESMAMFVLGYHFPYDTHNR